MLAAPAAPTARSTGIVGSSVDSPVPKANRAMAPNPATTAASTPAPWRSREPPSWAPHPASSRRRARTWPSGAPRRPAPRRRTRAARPRRVRSPSRRGTGGTPDEAVDGHVRHGVDEAVVQPDREDHGPATDTRDEVRESMSTPPRTARGVEEGPLGSMPLSPSETVRAVSLNGGPSRGDLTRPRVHRALSDPARCLG